MKTKAALLMSQPGQWEVHEVDLDEPKEHEIQVRMAIAGLCHSDAHWAAGDIQLGLMPYCGGHEGAGIVDKVGAGVTSLASGDHIVTSFIPVCGRCRWCARGMQNLCDNGRGMMKGAQLDGTFRLHLGPRDVGQAGTVSTFSQYTIMPEISAIKISNDIPLDVAALVSCGVPTGWGSAVNVASVRPGDVVIVAGIGGIGINAVQGARHAGGTHIIAADPVPWKVEMASKLGATHGVSSITEAAEIARELTNGQGADSTIIAIGVVEGEHVEAAVDSVRKGGTVVLTSAAAASKTTTINMLHVAMFQKRLQGALYGEMSPTADIPMLLDLWKAGQLELKGLITNRYRLEEINEGYADMLSGRNIRGIVDFSL